MLFHVVLITLGYVFVWLFGSHFTEEAGRIRELFPPRRYAVLVAFLLWYFLAVVVLCSAVFIVAREKLGARQARAH
ncbi:MAG: uncharacterized protein A8A55_1719 [Amphiamblys sp. WSBS2006]|nr:MAG: uncharacterized protein A8A55_1719 [Amphiamblys sp. WSBS2006]